jgi:hypothetical protein
MGAMRLTRGLVPPRSKLFPVAWVVCALLPGLWLGSVALFPPAAAATTCSSISEVSVVVRNNDPEVTLRLLSADHGATNFWCDRPSKTISPHSRSVFQVGDHLFESEVRAQYVSTNGEVITMFAASRFFGRPEASCSVAPQPALLRCDAVGVHQSFGGSNTTVADFNITR